MISLDLSDIYRRAFGIELFDNVIFPEVGKADLTESDITSYLGLPVFLPIIFKGGNYNILNKGDIETTKVETLRLSDSSLCDFRRSKNIVTTPINGGSGSVVEMWSFENWQIKIYGVLFPTDEELETQLDNLLEYEKITDAINVESWFFEKLGIHQIIIKDIDLPQIKGSMDVRPFVINCEAVEPVELIL